MFHKNCKSRPLITAELTNLQKNRDRISANIMQIFLTSHKNMAYLFNNFVTFD